MDYLPRQRALSALTLRSYRDSLKLLLQFVAGQKHDASQLTTEQLGVEKIAAFLQSLETVRRNRISTRNVRLSAIHSFFRYLGGQYPEHLEQTQRILSIPFKRTGTREIEHFDADEIQAVLKAVDIDQNNGHRDLALLSLMFNTGARVSEVVGLQNDDLRLRGEIIVIDQTGQPPQDIVEVGVRFDTQPLARNHEREEIGSLFSPCTGEKIYRSKKHQFFLTEFLVAGKADRVRGSAHENQVEAICDRGWNRDWIGANRMGL